MNKTKKTVPVIIFGGHITGYGVIRSLSLHKIPLYLVVGKKGFICQVSRYIRKTLILQHNDPDFIKKLNSWALNHVGSEAVLMIAGNDYYLDTLSKNYEKLLPGFKLTFPTWDTVRLVREKRNTYKIAQDLGIPTPKTYYIASKQELEGLFKRCIEAEFPLLMKAEDSKRFVNKYKTKGIVCNTREEVFSNYDKYNGFFGQLLLQEMIPGGEENLLNFIISLNKKSDMTGFFINRKRRSRKQFLSCTLMESCWSDYSIINDMALLLKKIKYYGYANPELKYDERDNQYKLIEINGRITISNSHAFRCGINIPFLMYKEANNYLLRIINKPKQVYKNNILWWHIAGDISAIFNSLKNHSFSLINFIKSFHGRGYVFEPFNLRDPFPGIKNLFFLCVLPLKRIFFKGKKL